MKLPDGWSRARVLFDDGNLVSCAGLVPVMALAERSGLSGLVTGKIRFKAASIKSAGANPAGKITSIVAGMACGADSIDDLDVIRSGGMPRLFDEVYAPATLGQFLREFTHGHALQLASVARAHLAALVTEAGLLPGIATQAYVDIDSLLRPVYGHAKQGASFGHTKIAGKQILRRGLSPLATTISTAGGAPVVAGIRLRAGRAGSAKGAASMVAEAIRTARAAGAGGEILVRGDSAYGSSAVADACLRAGARFSLVLLKNRPVQKAIASISETAWTPVHYPGAVTAPDTLRRDHPQPAARRRHPRRQPACRRPRRHAAPASRDRPSPAGPTTTPPRAAPAHALALGHALEPALGHRLHHRPASSDRLMT